MTPPRTASHPVPWLSRDAALALDVAAEKAGMPGDLLMENAGARMASEIRNRFPEAANVHVFVGPTRNGGDGLACARALLLHGVKTFVHLCNPEGRKLPAAWERQRSLLRIFLGKREDRTRVFPYKKPRSAALAVDALFGTGLSRPLEGPWLRILREIADLGAPVVALDVPSGLPFPGDGVAVLRADLTLAVQARKTWDLLPETSALCGEIRVVRTDFPREIETRFTRRFHAVTAVAEPPSGDLLHKASRGQSLLVAGSRRYPGAALLAGRSALQRGCPSLLWLSPAKPPLSRHPQVVPFSCAKDVVTPADLVALPKGKIRQALFGPGLDRSEESTEVLRLLLGLEGLRHLVIDADGLWHLARLVKTPHLKKALRTLRIVVTPHRGEFAALRDAAGVPASNLFDEHLAFVAATGLRTLVKDARSWYAVPRGREAWMFDEPNAVLAKAGSGDVLAGRILAECSLRDDVDEAVLAALRGQLDDASSLRERLGTRAPVHELLGRIR